jgi:hypothetical protein
LLENLRRYSQVAPPVSTSPMANFATSFASVVDTGGKFATGVVDIASQGAPPLSTTPVANLATRFASVVDTVGKFVTGVNVTGGILPPVSKKRHQGQFAAGVVDTISGFRDLKVNLKVKMYL